MRGRNDSNKKSRYQITVHNHSSKENISSEYDYKGYDYKGATYQYPPKQPFPYHLLDRRNSGWPTDRAGVKVKNRWTHQT